MDCSGGVSEERSWLNHLRLTDSLPVLCCLLLTTWLESFERWSLGHL